AEIMRAQVHLAGDAIRVELEASALAPLALPVPSAGDHWRIETLAVDGASALAVAREPDDALWVPLRSGAHTIRIVGRTLGDNLSLAFPLAPRTLGRRRGLGYLGRHRRTTGLGCAQSLAPATRRFGGRGPVLGGERGLPGL